MPKYRRDESQFHDMVEALKGVPAWVGPFLAVLIFAVVRYLVPMLVPTTRPGQIGASSLGYPLLNLLAWVLSGLVILAWMTAEAWKLANRGLFLSREGIDSVRKLSWREFERLVCEFYRRQGYVADHVGDDGTDGGDGGVDVELRRADEHLLVQCKHWKTYQVGVAAVRELMGVVAAKGATGGVLVTSGCFTRAAVRFAKTVPAIELIDGAKLVQMMRAVKADRRRTANSRLPANPAKLPVLKPAETVVAEVSCVDMTSVEQVPVVDDPPSSESLGRHKRASIDVAALPPPCPNCRVPMVLRLARKGPNAGSRFWGCMNYPKCRSTRQIP